MASKEKTACYLFCRVPFSCVVQATGETKNLLLVTPCIKALETWILFVLFVVVGMPISQGTNEWAVPSFSSDFSVISAFLSI